MSSRLVAQDVSGNLGNLGSLLTDETRPDVSDFTDVKHYFGAKRVMEAK